MKIGAAIAEIRKTNQMTQEEFAEIFHVTRQTISNWENEKSYPDLQTLVSISEQFEVSLDKMLKEDQQMVTSMDAKMRIGELVQRYQRGIKITAVCIMTAILVAAGIYTALWSSAGQRLEKKFQDGAQKYGFEYSENLGYYYRQKKDDVEFTLPNQKMPGWWDFSLDFHAKYLSCQWDVPQGTVHLIWNGENGKEYGWEMVDLEGNPVSREQAQELLKPYEEQMNQLCQEAQEIYQSVYQ